MVISHLECLEPRQLLSSIKGAIYVDLSANGKHNRGEQFVPDIQVYLDLNNNEALDAGEPLTATDRRGKYAFKKLAKSIYHIREMIPAGFAAIYPPGGAWYVDLRFKNQGGKKDFAYWPLSLGPAPVIGKGPILQNPAQPIVMYNTAATEANNADGTNTRPLLFGNSGEGADPYWVVQPPTTDGSTSAFQPAYYAFNPGRYNDDVQPASPQSDSAFIAPTTDGTEPLPPGQYLYATAFDLTGLDPKTVEITGIAFADDQVTDVRLNGLSLALSAQIGNALPLAIKDGFVPGINTLEFVVLNTGPDASPTALRVDALRGTGLRNKPGPIELFNTGVSAPNSADGSNPTRVATGGVDGHWQVSTPGPGLPFYSDDSAHHYVYSNGLTGGRFGNAFVASDSTVWFNDDLNPATAAIDSSFINPLGKAGSPLPAGTYIYRTWFDLTGLDADTAEITGTLMADGSVVNIFVNGNASNQGIGAGVKHGEEKTFTLNSGMVAGLNVLDFVVTIPTNGGSSGLRVDGLRGSAGGSSPRPTISFPLRLPLPAFPPLNTPLGPLPAAG